MIKLTAITLFCGVCRYCLCNLTQYRHSARVYDAECDLLSDSYIYC